MIKAIIFDFDGVLVESVDIKTKAFVQLFNLEEEDVVRLIISYHRKHCGISRFEKFRYIYKNILKRELSDKEFRYLCHKFSMLVANEVVMAPYVNGTKEFLDMYAIKYKCFVSSATPQNEIEDIVKRKHMKHYFVGVYGAPKKKKDVVKKVLSSYNLLPKEIVYIGDALSDYEAAHANSVSFIARVSYNEHIFDGIDCIKIKNLKNLEAALESIYKEIDSKTLCRL